MINRAVYCSKQMANKEKSSIRKHAFGASSYLSVSDSNTIWELDLCVEKWNWFLSTKVLVTEIEDEGFIYTVFCTLLKSNKNILWNPLNEF